MGNMKEVVDGRRVKKNIKKIGLGGDKPIVLPLPDNVLQDMLRQVREAPKMRSPFLDSKKNKIH